MMQYFYILLVLIVAGCASQPHETASPKIDRLTPEELARITPQPVAKLSLEDIVNMSKRGNSAEQIIARIQASDSLYDLSPSQSLALSGDGVDSKVLDYIHERNALAQQNNFADEINRRERQKQAELNVIKNRVWQQRRYYDPFCRFGRFGYSPFGFGGIGSRFGHRFGVGAGIGMPLGCW